MWLALAAWVSIPPTAMARIPGENGVGGLPPHTAPHVTVRSSPEEYLNAAWTAVALAQSAEQTDPTQARNAWDLAIHEVESLSADHPSWVQQARQQGEWARKEPAFPSVDSEAERHQVLQTYGALYHLGTAQFIRVMSYSHLGEEVKALEAATEIITHYQWAQAWDPRGWFWSVVRSLEAEYPTLHQQVLIRMRERPKAVSSPSPPAVATPAARPRRSPSPVSGTIAPSPVSRARRVSKPPPVPTPTPSPATVPAAPRVSPDHSLPVSNQKERATSVRWSPQPLRWLLPVGVLGLMAVGTLGWRIGRRYLFRPAPSRPSPAPLPGVSSPAPPSPAILVKEPPPRPPIPTPVARPAPQEPFDLVGLIREAQYFAKPERAFAFWIHRHGGATAKMMILRLSETDQLTALERAGYQWVAAQLRKIHRQYPTFYFETIARSLQALPRCRPMLGDDYVQWIKALLEVVSSEGFPADQELPAAVSAIVQDATLDETTRHLALETLVHLGKAAQPKEPAVDLPQLLEMIRAESLPNTPKAIAHVVWALAHPNQEVATAVYQRLAALNRPLVRRTLLQRLSTVPHPLAGRILELLTHYGTSAIPELMEALGHSSDTVRQAAQELLFQLKDQAFADLAIAIRQPERGRTVRLATARLLHRLYLHSKCQWEIREALLAVSQDSDPVLQRLSSFFLERIGGPG